MTLTQRLRLKRPLRRLLFTSVFLTSPPHLQFPQFPQFPLRCAFSTSCIQPLYISRFRFFSSRTTSIAMPPKSSAAPIAVKPNALKGKSLIVTGEIEGYNRKAAEAILINAGATIEKSLNKKVQLVVLGADPGANKLEKIAALGVETKDWDDVVKTIKVDGNAAPAPADEEDEDEDEDDEDDDDDEEEEDDEVEEVR
ncbi:hypothetical protein K504DRAFT_206704 [Pleomassaria siparia CBS 279.74]|uniref:BRCT domain-containing protein n=1 Tax=Pleomassaria siparia CBS 279.74 TaxID=1314801 RepID=A0A6G1KIE4_9PLEO|nr:hypothetical protein K504DRAFT_206704 [Pleomassaria siparia CBS 279.74]